ncbi:hypothetical protein [Streptomyces sp. WM6386]|uniref:hypothetical protein n=1 Tax=Streptomyces sp. WM6386 TaxID=1415558 RepID=UPI00131B5468|nr:hypothetical protein [Streptomyces sp. WM6386]
MGATLGIGIGVRVAARTMGVGRLTLFGVGATPGTGVRVAAGIGVEPLPEAPRRFARRREDPHAG